MKSLYEKIDTATGKGRLGAPYEAIRQGAEDSMNPGPRRARVRTMRGTEGAGKVAVIALTALLLVLVGLNGVVGGVGDAIAEDFMVPDTGQDKCYDNSGEIPCPAPGADYYGQDAQYQGPQPTYQDNGNGTVTDAVTGLIWQQADDGVARTWQNAIDYCDGLELAGYYDWRLPTDLELMSIVDYGRYDPAIDTDFFPSCRSAWYWSGSTGAGGTGVAWRVHFGNGSVGSSSKSNGHYVRCVRSGP